MARTGSFYGPTDAPAPSPYLPPDARIDPDAPLLAATIGGRPVVLARPKIPGPGGETVTIPVSISRLRRAIDQERGRDAAPYRESLIDDYPLAYAPMWPLSGVPTSVSLRVGLFGLAIGATMGFVVVRTLCR
jgi:hypothetical protein